MNRKYEEIFSSFTLANGETLKNRIVMAPMTNFASHENGEVSDEEIAYYAERSGGVGAVITACAYVTRNGKGFQGEFGADSDEMIPSLTRLASTIKDKGSKAILQIFHGGRMCPPELILNEQPVSASAVAPERPEAVEPREMTNAEIEEVIQAFGLATKRAIAAGFDGVEIHGANTYLIQQFFSPHSNRRTDKWGGSLEKRMAFPLAIVNEVKKVASEHGDRSFIVGYRLSPEEGENPGITMDDTLQLVHVLNAQGLDYLHVSVQDFWSGSMRDKSDTTSRILMIKERATSVPVIGVGSLHTPEDVVKVMKAGIPLVALGRELIMEPQWVEKVVAGEEETIRTSLSRDSREELVVPTLLWTIIMNSPGWFPVQD